MEGLKEHLERRCLDGREQEQSEFGSRENPTYLDRGSRQEILWVWVWVWVYQVQNTRQKYKAEELPLWLRRNKSD